MRSTILDLLNIEAGPLAEVARAPWVAIAAKVSRASRSDRERQANLGVAKAHFDLATEHGVAGRRHEIFPLNVGVSEKISYWSPAVIAIDGRAVVPFIDPRRERKWLTSAARQFVFSVMHQRFIADPDLDGVEPCIVQFDSSDGDGRARILHFLDRIELLDFDTLDAVVRNLCNLERSA